MRYHEFSSPHPATLDKASSRETANNPNVVFQADEIEGGEIAGYITHDANALMRRVLRSVWQDAITDIGDML